MHTACNVVTAAPAFDLEDEECRLIVFVIAERNDSADGRAYTVEATRKSDKQQSTSCGSVTTTIRSHERVRGGRTSWLTPQGPV